MLVTVTYLDGRRDKVEQVDSVVWLRDHDGRLMPSPDGKRVLYVNPNAVLTVFIDSSEQ